MKKSWKIFWIICISLAVLGIALCISGVVLGATVGGIREVFGIHERWEDYFWDGDSSEAAEYSDGSVSGGTEYAASDSAGTKSASSAKQNAGSGASGSGYSGIRKLDIDVTCLEVAVVKGEGSEIVLDTNDISEKFMKDLEIRQKGEELKIEVKDRKSWEKWAKNQYKSQGTLLVQIPEGMRFDEAALKIGAGILRADDIQASELDVEVGAGEVSLESFAAEEFDLECGAGEAYVSGDASKEAKIECGVGSVTYTALGNQQDYNYELSCGIGELNVGDQSFSGLGSEHKINNNGSRSMEIECGIGSVTVVFEE